MYYNLNKINEFSSNVSSEITSLKLETFITYQTSTLQGLTNKISRDYSEYINTIILGMHNIISPYIIAPKNLLEELQKYQVEYDLVIRPDPLNILLLYNLIKLNILHTDKITIFAIQEPLVGTIYFDLYLLIPLPIQHANPSIFFYIIPKHEYLLLSQSKMKFISLRVLSDCIEYLEGKYLCSNAFTIQSSEQPSCEVQLLSPHINFIPDDCQIQTIKAIIETWKYVNKNQWIYVLQKPTTLTIIFKEDENRVIDIIVHQTGLIHLEKHCKGYTNIQCEAHKVLQNDTTQTIDHIQKSFRQKFQCSRRPSYSTTLFFYRWRR